MSESTHDCERVRDLWDRETAGESLSGDDAAFVEEHLSGCADCLLENRSVDAMRADGPEGPPRFTDDDIARRRFVDETLALAGAKAKKPGQKSKSILPYVAAAAAAALVIGTIAFFARDNKEVPVSPTAAPTIASQNEILPVVAEQKCAILMLSGEARVAGVENTDESSVAAGALVETGWGSAVLDLSSGVAVLLREQSRLRVNRLDGDAIEVELLSGRLLSVVDPARRGPEFKVATGRGEVRVTGTVFSVSVEPEKVRVAVARGKVSLTESGSEARSVGVGEAAELGAQGLLPLSGGEKEDAREAMKIMGVLSGSNNASVNIKSLPEGAVVTIDAETLGLTPLAASIRPGHREIELSMEGRAPVRELLDIKKGEEISRVFDLKIAALQKDKASHRGSGPASAAPPISASNMLAWAQKLRAKKEWNRAAEAYEEIIAKSPGGTEARMSLISLGGINLDNLKNPARALSYFDQYLVRSKSGSLAQEASWGRLRALRALGARAEEKAALGKFMKDFPDAVQRQMAEQRLRDLE